MCLQLNGNCQCCCCDSQQQSADRQISSSSVDVKRMAFCREHCLSAVRIVVKWKWNKEKLINWRSIYWENCNSFGFGIERTCAFGWRHTKPVPGEREKRENPVIFSIIVVQAIRAVSARRCSSSIRPNDWPSPLPDHHTVKWFVCNSCATIIVTSAHTHTSTQALKPI